MLTTGDWPCSQSYAGPTKSLLEELHVDGLFGDEEDEGEVCDALPHALYHADQADTYGFCHHVNEGVTRFEATVGTPDQLPLSPVPPSDVIFSLLLAPAAPEGGESVPPSNPRLLYHPDTHTPYNALYDERVLAPPTPVNDTPSHVSSPSTALGTDSARVRPSDSGAASSQSKWTGFPQWSGCLAEPAYQSASPGYTTPSPAPDTSPTIGKSHSQYTSPQAAQPGVSFKNDSLQSCATLNGPAATRAAAPEAACRLLMALLSAQLPPPSPGANSGTPTTQLSAPPRHQQPQLPPAGGAVQRQQLSAPAEAQALPASVFASTDFRPHEPKALAQLFAAPPCVGSPLLQSTKLHLLRILADLSWSWSPPCGAHDGKPFGALQCHAFDSSDCIFR
eukprot:GHVT01033433.1.p1 GENE.GHVT01033433.1~~GHVT01033433.1.p1  ORF type:complete len:392 (-),score=59.87 GHVT01033433.1:2522-3697(-)